MPTLTTPDKLPWWGPLEPAADLDAKLKDLALATQAALAKRQQGTYVWTDDASRDQQTGMFQGDLGYVLATKTAYRFDGGAWRLATPYVEFVSPAQSVASATYAQPAALNMDAVRTTDTAFVVGGADGYVTVVDPGIYAVNWLGKIPSGAVGATAFMTITSDTTHLDYYSVIGFTAGVCTVSIPFIRVTAPNTRLYLWMYQSSGGAQLWNGRLSIGRVA